MKKILLTLVLIAGVTSLIVARNSHYDSHYNQKTTKNVRSTSNTDNEKAVAQARAKVTEATKNRERAETASDQQDTFAKEQAAKKELNSALRAQKNQQNPKKPGKNQ